MIPTVAGTISYIFAVQNTMYSMGYDRPYVLEHSCKNYKNKRLKWSYIYNNINYLYFKVVCRFAIFNTFPKFIG